MHGGDRIAAVFAGQGVRFVFTLCGGHISPILVGSKRLGIRVVDVRHEATAVFAADAVARLTGVPGVAVVTAGPGVTNTVTALKNAQMAQSPVVLLGGAAPTALQGRGALQDIDHLELVASLVKWRTSVRRVRDLTGAVERAFAEARRGVPGPVFVECPADLLYGEPLVREWYAGSVRGRSLSDRALRAYLGLHVRRLFAGADRPVPPPAPAPPVPEPQRSALTRAARRLRRAQRPVLVIGSQAVIDTGGVAELAVAVERLGAPVYLSGMARGLLGRGHPLQMRHARRRALREADLVLLAGVPADFRLEYGSHIPRSATYVSLNRSAEDLRRNRKPDVGVAGDAGLALRRLARRVPYADAWAEWRETLRRRDEERDLAIRDEAARPTELVAPLRLCATLDRTLPDDAVLVGDGGDFVATASYVVRPPGPLSWLDPGAFGTLGVGAGFALAAKLCRPEAEVWLLWGDGAAGYGLSELDSFVRHRLPVIALVGNDASWAQIAREQVEILGDDVATRLARTDYHRVAEGWGARGLLLDRADRIADILREARTAAAAGEPVLINALLARSEFRKGSISM